MGQRQETGSEIAAVITYGRNWEKTMSAVVDSHGHGHAHDHGDHHGGYGGIMRWITTTNHKDIGTMYLWFSFLMFGVGGIMALVIRAELFSPGLQFVNPDFFNQLTTMHGLVMIFGAIMPPTWRSRASTTGRSGCCRSPRRC